MVTEAKDALRRARASARGPGVQEVLAQVTNSPEIKAAQDALTAAKKPAEVVTAIDGLAKARRICADRAAAIQNKFAPEIAMLQKALADAQNAVPKSGPPMSTKEVLASLNASASASGPLTELSAGSSRRPA